MLSQLWPLLIVGTFFTLYGLARAAYDIWCALLVIRAIEAENDRTYKETE